MVYVDEVRPCIQSRYWPYTHSCHLYADTLDELERFAEKLHLRPTWRHDSIMPHYDLTASKHTQAIKLGAHQQSLSQMVQMLRKWRKNGSRVHAGHSNIKAYA